MMIRSPISWVSMTRLDFSSLATTLRFLHLNNNLNDSLSILTIVSVLLAVLAVVQVFFGMNVPLPFTEKANALVISWLKA